MSLKNREKNLKNRAGLVILIDPDKVEKLDTKIKLFDELGVDLFFLGSSQPVKADIDLIAKSIKNVTNLPLVIFPGAPNQVSKEADAVLFLSLISGRNPDYLINNHVIAAPFIKSIGLDVIPTGYILIESGTQTSVELISKTNPLSSDNISNIVNHAIAGEFLGMKCIYLEAGSGALNHVSVDIVKAVKKNIDIPIIVGGGIRDEKTVKHLVDAGADFIVIGNHLEKTTEAEGIKTIKSFLEAVK